MKHYGNLIIPDFFRVNSKLGAFNVAEGDTLELLESLESQMRRLAPENEYGYRHLWMAVPRGDISQWCAKPDWDELNAGSDDSLGYEGTWENDFPLETAWFNVEFAEVPDRDYHGIVIRDGRDYHCTVRNSRRDTPGPDGLKDFLVKILAALTSLVDDVCADTEGYNAFVERNLPAQYRYGRIARRDLDRIAPFRRLDIKEPELAKKVLQKIIAGEFAPKKGLAIREYLRYFHIAYLAFCNALPEDYDGSLEWDIEDDVNFYTQEHGDRLDGLDLCNPKDLDRIQYDHYGEIALTRLNIHVDNTRQDGALVSVDCSYVSTISRAVNIAVALYKAGAPLTMPWAEMMLAAVEGTDEIRVRPYTFHDYLGADCEGCGGTIEIPFEYELGCSDWTKDSLAKFIRLTEWDRLDPVRPDVGINARDEGEGTA